MPATFLARDSLAGAKDRVRYTRLLADFTRYNRVSPQSQLNFRLVFGAGFNGDALPLERRFALGGAGTLPGYDFRNSAHSEDVLTCDGGPHPAVGLPAECDHMLLGQVEFRHDARIRLFGRRDADGAQRFRIDRQVAFVAFADGGRGWLTGERVRELRYPSTSFPSLDTFKYDAGAGIDVHYLGFYVAKSLTDWSNSAKFIVRLRHRF